MGSLAAFLEAAGDDFFADLMTVVSGLDGLAGLFLGSVGDLIGAAVEAAGD